MANPTLLKSALFFGSYHVLISVLYAPMLLEFVIIIGVLTSIYNHGTTSFHAQWLDRVAIFFACIVDILYFTVLPYPINLIIIPLFGVTISLYFIAKWAIKKGQCGNKYHLGSHCLASFMHSIMLIYLIEYTSIDNTSLLLRRFEMDAIIGGDFLL